MHNILTNSGLLADLNTVSALFFCANKTFFNKGFNERKKYPAGHILQGFYKMQNVT